MMNTKQNKKALFFSFEGIDGCGKSVQAESLYRYLKQSGYTVTLFREPGGTAISEKIRSILLDNTNTDMEPLTELLLYEAARAQLVREKIYPLMDTGSVIIADRFFDSTTAYQGYGRSISLQDIDFLNNMACDRVIPDRTYVLDISWQESQNRRHKNSCTCDRMENQHKEFFRKIKYGFKELARQHPERIVILKGEQPLEKIKTIIQEDALNIIKNKPIKQHKVRKNHE